MSASSVFYTQLKIFECSIIFGIVIYYSLFNKHLGIYGPTSYNLKIKKNFNLLNASIQIGIDI